MKKNLNFTVLLIAVLMFTGCPNPNNADPGDGADSGAAGIVDNDVTGTVDTGDTNTGNNTVTFDDCTEIISPFEIVLSDGNWAVKAEAEYNSKTQTYNLAASVTGGVVKYNSGTFTVSSDLADYMTADEISSFKQLTQEQKEEMISQMAEIPLEEVSIRIEGTKFFLTTTMSESDFSRHIFKLDEIPEGTEIKTNAGKTKYTFSRLFGDGFTATYYINKL